MSGRNVVLIILINLPEKDKRKNLLLDIYQYFNEVLREQYYM